MRKFLKKANFNFSLQSCTHHFLHREANRRQNANGWIFRAFLYIYIYNLFDLQRRGSFSQTTKSCWRCHFTASDQRLCSLLILTSCFLKLRAKANKAEISTQLCITTTNPHSPATRPPHPNHLLSPHFHIFIQVRPPCRRPHASSYLSRCEDAGDIWNNGCGLMKMTRGTLSVQNEGWGVFFFFVHASQCGPNVCGIAWMCICVFEAAGGRTILDSYKWHWQRSGSTLLPPAVSKVQLQRWRSPEASTRAASPALWPLMDPETTVIIWPKAALNICHDVVLAFGSPFTLFFLSNSSLIRENVWVHVQTN